MPSLQSLTFDTSAFRSDHQDADRKVWFTKEGDGISLNFFDVKPNLPSDMWSAQNVHDFYLSMLTGTPAKLVELSIVEVAETSCIRLIIKSPQKPSGLTYLGSITVPFQEFSFVIKCQCQEQGMTGIREAILFDKMHRTGRISLDAAGKIAGDWNPRCPKA